MARAFLPFLGGRAVGAALFSALVGFAAQPAAADPINVVVDQAKVMRISRPADVVIIGNPAIADATIQDNQTLIITGHSFGTTNLIVLDASGQSIANEMITVGPQNESVVTVYRRAARETLSCNPDCAPTLTLGDSPQVFDTVNTQVSTHTSLSNDAASSK